MTAPTAGITCQMDVGWLDVDATESAAPGNWMSVLLGTMFDVGPAPVVSDRDRSNIV